MSTKKRKITDGWKHPDELIRLQRMNLRRKQLAARLSHNNAIQEITENNKESLLEAKIAQKRKNPFAKADSETNKKSKTDLDLPAYDSILALVSTPRPSDSAESTFVRETPSQPIPAKLKLQPFDSKTFAKLFNTQGTNDCDNETEVQKFSKHLPMDWTLKSRARFFCTSELPATTLKTSQMASGLTSFVRCIDTLTSSGSLDISPATRFNQATYYWQHPHLPWLKLFPRNAKDNIGITLGDREKKSLAEEWDYSFRGLFQLLRARQCPYFYLCANTFTVLFRAAGTGGRVETHALMTPSTRGMRSALRHEGIEYTMPLKKTELGLNKSDDSTSLGNIDIEKEAEFCNDNDDNESEDDAWLESLEVDDKEIRRIQTAHKRQIKAKDMAEDFSDNSLLLIEGIECQGFFSFLLNAKSAISNVGRLAGVPPTLYAPVAFPKATMQHLTVRSSKVRMDGVDYNSIELKGLVLPTCLPYVCHLFSESKRTFSATLASFNNTLAFSKATQKLLDENRENCKKVENNQYETGGQVFGQENLSDCGLLPCVIENMCRTGPNTVGLIERICYNSDYGYAWS